MKLAIIAVLMCIAVVVAGLQPAADRGNRQTPASTSLQDWRGLKVIVYLHVEQNPRSGVPSFNAGTSPGGLHSVDGLPVSVLGVLSSVSDSAVVIKGEGN